MLKGPDGDITDYPLKNFRPKYVSISKSTGSDSSSVKLLNPNCG